jgi:hypothetical protein
MAALGTSKTERSEQLLRPVEGVELMTARKVGKMGRNVENAISLDGFPLLGD